MVVSIVITINIERDVRMSAVDNEEGSVLKSLKEGGSLRYFFLHGGVAVHGQDGSPDRTQTCAIGTFLDLRDKELIEQTEREVTGYPYYANNRKSSIYRITQKGLQAAP